MKSFAFWCKNKSGKTGSASVMMNFNLWIEYDKKRNIPFLDVGIMIKGIDDVEEMYFYVPFNISKEDISDLGNVLASDPKILNAIFNESYTIKNSGGKQVVVSNKAEEELFSVYSLDINSDIICSFKL